MGPGRFEIRPASESVGICSYLAIERAIVKSFEVINAHKKRNNAAFSQTVLWHICKRIELGFMRHETVPVLGVGWLEPMLTPEGKRFFVLHAYPNYKDSPYCKTYECDVSNNRILDRPINSTALDD